jgi:hypothetical protein
VKKLLVTALLVAASLLVVGTTLTANATSKTTPCKTVKFKVTRQVWNAKHTKKITVDVYKLVKESIKQDGKVDVFYIKEQVYKETRICTAAVSVTSTTAAPVSVPVTTVPVQVTTPAPVTITEPTTTTTTVPPTTTTTTTTTVPPSTTTTTAPPGPGSITTATTQAAPNTDYTLPAGTCTEASSCYSEMVFSVVVKAPDVDVAPAAGDVWFVFDAPVIDNGTANSDPYEYNEFTLQTTQNGQTSCPISWVSSHVETPAIWQADPISVAADGIPACTMTDISLGMFVLVRDGPTPSSAVVEYTCSPPQPNYGLPSTEYCPVNPATEVGGDIIGSALTWEVTAEFTGEGVYAASWSAPQDFAVGP